MKKLLIISVLVPLFLISCGKSEEVKTVVNPPVVEKQVVTTSPVVTTGSIIESSTGKIEKVSTGSIFESGSELLTTGTGKEFNIDDFLEKGTYSIVKKENRNEYTVYTIDKNSSNKKLDNDTEPSCLGYGNSSCINFITKNNSLLYSNLEIGSNNLKEDIGGLYKIYTNGVAFFNRGGEGAPGGGVSWYDFTYINFPSGKRIYEDYSESSTWETDKDLNEVPGTLETKISKVFYDLSKGSNDRKSLNLKATNIEDAYFEYYKEVK